MKRLLILFLGIWVSVKAINKLNRANQIDAFSENLFPRTRLQDSELRNSMKTAKGPTKIIFAPVIGNDQNHVTFSVNSLGYNDRIIYVQLRMMPFWTAIH